MTQSNRKYKKLIYFDRNAEKEYRVLPLEVQEEFKEILKELAFEGRLEEPYAKKFRGTSLYEIRIRMSGAWRGLYAYLEKNKIIILSFFNKKTQKTPLNIIKKALKRLQNY